MQYSPGDIERIKQSTDIVALFASYGHKAEQRGKDYFIKCPFHDDDNASLSITKEKGLWHCFGCNAKGNAIQLIEKIENIPFLDAVKKLSGRGIASLSGETVLSQPLPKHHNYNEPNPTERPALLQRVFERFKEYYQNLPEGKRYLNEVRKLDHQLTFEMVGYCPSDFGSKLDSKDKAELLSLGVLNKQNKPFFSECVVFALRDTGGQIQSLYGRSVNDKGSHYYLPGSRGGVLGVFHESHPLIIVESCLDALTLLQKGFGSVLALHGVNGFEGTHEAFLKHHYIKDIVLLLDGDAAGREASSRLAQKLQGLKYRVKTINLPENEDPNGYIVNNEAVKWLREQMNPPVKAMALKSCWEKDTLVIEGERFCHRVQGLNPNGLDHLKVTLKTTLQSNLEMMPYIDTVDLYSGRQRERLMEEWQKVFMGSLEEMISEIAALTQILDQERLKLREIITPHHYEMNDTEKEKASQYLKAPNLIGRLRQDLDELIVGEKGSKVLGYFCALSRLLEIPLSMLVVSRSGAGKTTLQKLLCSLVPPEDLIKYTRISSQALYYMPKDALKHKVLAIEEDEGVKDSQYSVKLLMSEQVLKSGITRSDLKSGRWVVDDYEVEGPVSVSIATTNPELDFETKNRMMIATIDESPEQTKRIQAFKRRLASSEGLKIKRRLKMIKADHQNIQRLLKPIRVVNDYLEELVYPTDVLQDRRDFDKYMVLMMAIALFHQYQRPHYQDEEGEYIKVELEDITLANELVLEFFPNSLEELAPHSRRLGEEISRLVQSQGGDVHFTKKRLRDFCGWSDWSVRQGLKQLEELGYVGRISGQNGVLIIYEMLVDVTQEARKRPVLTDVDELRKLIAKRKGASL